MAGARSVSSASVETTTTTRTMTSSQSSPSSEAQRQPPPPPPPPPPSPSFLPPSPLRAVLSTGARTTSAAHAAWDALVRPGDFAIDATAGNGNDTLKLARLVAPSGSVLALDTSPFALRSTLHKLEEEAARRRACGAEPLGRVDLVLGCHSRVVEAVRERERRRKEEGEEEERLSLWSLGEEEGEEEDEEEDEDGESSSSSSSSLPQVALAAFNLGYLPKFDDVESSISSSSRSSGSNGSENGSGGSENEPPPSPPPLDEQAQLATATRPQTTVLAVQATASRLIAPGGTVSICSYFQHEGGGAEAEAVREALRPFDPRTWTCVESRVLNRPEAPVLTLCYRSTRPKKKKKEKKEKGEARG